jgi:two-component system cell cycle sensor histidine kinase/response regulator CckA
VALSYVFTNQLTYPIISLRETTDRIMHGDLTARADITTGDEVEELAASFNKMAEGIMQARDALERRVEERTSELKKAYGNLLQEVTERKRLEEELLKSQKLESIGILAGGIAHDFNNILTAILTYISLANIDASPGTKLSKRLSEAEKATLRAGDLTRQLLTFSKGGQPVMTSVVLNQLIRDSADFVLRGSNVKSEYIIAEDLWPVEADEGQISQVINNLAINAGQAMPEGGIVEISAKNMTVNEESGLPLKEGKYVNISIKDHGHGVPEEILPKIFDPYFTTKQIGSGLGLAVTYSIIKNHNGHIAVTSKAGSETTFDIYLPASDKQCLTDVSKDEKIETGSGRILIMDDQEMIRDATGEILKNLGYEVETCIDGAEAVELFRQAKESGHPFDAVIMDLTVPGGMGGMEAMGKLIELDPEVRAIVSSGYSNDPVMSNFREYGFREVIVKPYKISEVSKKLRRVLSVQL